MGWLESAFGAVVKALWKVVVAVVLLVVIASLIHWAQSNPRQAQATTDKVMGAGASVIGWGADGITNMTGGSADTVRGSGGRLIWVQDEAPGYWPVRQAVANWNKGLKTVHLKVGDCQSGAQCIKVTEVPEMAPNADGNLVLGRTTRFFGTSVRFNRDAVHQVPRTFLAVAACHELGHALGLGHRTAKTTCMQPTVAHGVPAKPDKADFAAVNAEYGR